MIYFASIFNTEKAVVDSTMCAVTDINKVEICAPVCEPDANCKPSDCPVICCGK